jgi:hypothetical protein
MATLRLMLTQKQSRFTFLILVVIFLAGFAHVSAFASSRLKQKLVVQKAEQLSAVSLHTIAPPASPLSGGEEKGNTLIASSTDLIVQGPIVPATVAILLLLGLLHNFDHEQSLFFPDAPSRYILSRVLRCMIISPNAP